MDSCQAVSPEGSLCWAWSSQWLTRHLQDCAHSRARVLTGRHFTLPVTGTSKPFSICKNLLSSYYS